MAFVSPSTRSTGDIITAGIWNQDVVNNIIASAPDIFTTQGDIVYASAADTAARLGIAVGLLKGAASPGNPAWTGIGAANEVMSTNAGGNDLEWRKADYNMLNLAQGSVATFVDDSEFAVNQYAFASPGQTRPGSAGTAYRAVNLIGFNDYSYGVGTQRLWHAEGDAGAGNPSVLTWDYVTASGKPRVWVIVDAAGMIRAMWEAEDPADPDEPDQCPLGTKNKAGESIIPIGGAVLPIALDIAAVLNTLLGAVSITDMPAWASKPKWSAYTTPDTLLAAVANDYIGKRHLELLPDIRDAFTAIGAGDTREWYVQLWLRCASRVLYGHANYTLIDLIRERFSVNKTGKLVLK